MKKKKKPSIQNTLDSVAPNPNRERLNSFKDAFHIVQTGKSQDGKTSYSSLGVLNQAAWIGEQSGWLIRRIETLEAALNTAISQDPAHWQEIARAAV